MRLYLGHALCICDEFVLQVPTCNIRSTYDMNANFLFWYYYNFQFAMHLRVYSISTLKTIFENKS